MKNIPKTEYPPKVLAMYRAVIDLLNAGSDIDRLKVSDITGKAGIGKGTAYEYFSSKEEIIVGALVYDTHQLLESLWQLQSQEESFEGKIRMILTWISRELKESRTFARIIYMENGNTELNHIIQDKRMQKCRNCHKYQVILDELLDVGRRQGVVKEPNPYAARMAVISQIFGLMMYMGDPGLQEEASINEAVEISYRNILKLLGE